MKILMNAITTEYLKKMVCEGCGNKDPECNGIYMRPRCHPNSATRTSYLNFHHAIAVECAKCGQGVVTIKLAAETAPPPKNVQ